MRHGFFFSRFARGYTLGKILALAAATNRGSGLTFLAEGWNGSHLILMHKKEGDAELPSAAILPRNRHAKAQKEIEPRSVHTAGLISK